MYLGSRAFSASILGSLASRAAIGVGEGGVVGGPAGAVENWRKSVMDFLLLESLPGFGATSVSWLFVLGGDRLRALVRERPGGRCFGRIVPLNWGRAGSCGSVC